MALTKQRKILGSVMALGLGALALDRLVIGPPEQASATQPIQAPVTEPQAPGEAGADAEAKASLEEGLPSFESLTQRLITASESAEASRAGGDPFALPDGWQTAAELAATPQPRDQSVFAEKLLDDYRLSGIAKSGDEHLAVINGLPIRVGQPVRLQVGDEAVIFELIEIDHEHRKAVWRSRAEEPEVVVMSVPNVLD